MSTNRAGKSEGYRGTKFHWEVFDRLPRKMKDFLLYETLTPLHTGRDIYDLTPAAERAMRERQRLATYAVYGPDHPQAQVPSRPRDRLVATLSDILDA
jgi:hypothetical protein